MLLCSNVVGSKVGLSNNEDRVIQQLYDGDTAINYTINNYYNYKPST